MALVANVKVMSATVAFPNIQEATISFSFHTEIQKQFSKSLKMIWRIVVKMEMIY